VCACVSIQASRASATVRPSLGAGGATVSSAAARCASRFVPRTVRLTCCGRPLSSLPTNTRTSHTPGLRSRMVAMR